MISYSLIDRYNERLKKMNPNDGLYRETLLAKLELEKNYENYKETN